MILAALKYGPVTYQATALERVSSEEIVQTFFATADRAPVYGKCISSRHFDAIGTGTVQILLQGRYNDILTPDVHYLAIASDFSNDGEVARRFSDRGEQDRIRQAALEHVLAAHTYDHRIESLAARLGA
jgi:spore maturation protein CgeB